MGEQNRLLNFPRTLVESVQAYELDGNLVCTTAAEGFAASLRLDFDLPTPLDMNATHCFIRKLENIRVFYQPNLEHCINVRGLWLSVGENSFIFIEEKRPSPSQIRTLMHEVSEKMLAISHCIHPEIPEPPIRERELWANRVAAAVKMPPRLFLHQVDELGLDLEALREANDETLACVARRVRDLAMQGHVYYWCRFDIAPYGLSKCEKLARLAESLGGVCIRVVDVTHTKEVQYGRRGSALPGYNLPSYYHYRILNPLMNRYIERNRPVLLKTLEGGGSGEFGYRDLFGEHQLCALLVPYGLRQTRGFFLVAVHPNERFRLQSVIDRLQPEERGNIDWLFSWYSYTHKQPAPSQLQSDIPGLGDCPPEFDDLFAKQFGREPYLWLTTNNQNDFSDSTKTGAA